MFPVLPTFYSLHNSIKARINLNSPEINVTPNLQKSPIYRVRGLKNWQYPDLRTGPENCTTLKNVNLTRIGTVKRRNGTAYYNTSQVSAGAVACVGLYQQLYKDGTTRNIEAFGTKLYTNDGTTRTDITGALTITNNAAKRVRSAYVGGKLVQTNGLDVTWTISNTGNAAALTGMPWSTCEDIVVHKNLCIALNTTESSTKFPTRLRWCGINSKTFVIDLTTWNDLDRFEVYPEGTAIVGAADNFGRLLIFKEDGLYPGSLTFSNGYIEFVLAEDQIFRGFQPIAKNSIVSRPEFTWCIAQDGAYIITTGTWTPQSNTGRGGVQVPNANYAVPVQGGYLRVNKVSGDLQNDWNTLFNHARLQYAVSYFRSNERQVRTLLSTSTNNTGHDIELVYDWDTGDVWWDYPTTKFNFANSFLISSVEYDWAGDLTGYAYQVNTGSADNGSTINQLVVQSQNDLGLSGINKAVVWANILHVVPDTAVTLPFIFHLNQDRLNPISKNVTFGTSLTYDSGLQYDTGLTYPGGTNASARVFINRICDTIAPEWSGTGAVNIVGVQYEFKQEE